MSQSITLREFITKWGFEVDDKELEKLDKKFAQTRESMGKLSENIAAAGAKMSLFVTAPFLAFAGASAHAAADAIDVSDKFTAIFKSLGDNGVAAAQEFSKAVGVSNVEGQKLLSTQGQILKSMGFSEQQAFDMSRKMGVLAADIAEFNSLQGGAAEATDIMKAALAGQTRGLKQIGVVIDDDIVKKKIQQNAAAGLRFKTLQQATAYATLALIQEKTKDATGAFADSQDELGVKMQVMRAKLANIAVAFGRIVLPPLLKLIDKVSGLVDWIDSLSTGSKTFILIMGGVAAAIGPALLGLSAMLNSIMTIRTAWVLFGNTALLAQAKVLAVPLLIAAAVVALGLVIEDIVAFFQGKDSVTGVILEKFKEMFGWLEEKFAGLPGWARGLVIAVTSPFRSLMAMIRGVGNAAGALIKGDFAGAGMALVNAGKDALMPSVNALMGSPTTSLSETLGFGAPGKVAPTTIPQSVNSPLATPTVNQQVTSPITINVPAGTPPEKVGPFVQKGVGDGMGQLLRETQRATKTAVSN